jgi:hypothetical protein
MPTTFFERGAADESLVSHASSVELASQSVQNVLPVPVENVPGAQDVHASLELAPAVALNVPSGHPAHSVAPLVEYEPAAHEAHVSAVAAPVAFENVPAVHS